VAVGVYGHADAVVAHRAHPISLDTGLG